MIRPTAIIAEDEENLRLSLRKMLFRIWPDLNICGEAENGEEAIKLIEQENPDFVFLDIQMPEMTGLEVAQRVSEKNHVIFVTAYDQYAVQAFENEAIDYLLKPITEERMRKTIARLKKRVQSPKESLSLDNKIETIIKTLEAHKTAENLRLIQVKCGTDIQFIPVSQVLFFRAEYKYTTVQTALKEFIIKTPIRELEERLDSEQFWRIHRSTIVNIDKINKIKRSITNGMLITFADLEIDVKVSRKFEHLFKHM